MRATKPRTWRQRIIAYSDDDRTITRPAAPRAIDDSYIDGPVPGLEGSQSSLNKRLASVAGLDDADPTDFKFLFEARGPSSNVRSGAAGVESAEPTDFKFLFEARGPSSKILSGVAGVEAVESPADGAEKTVADSAPSIIEDGEYRWIRTNIRRGSDLVDGQAWISEFTKRLTEEAEAGDVADSRPGQRPSRRAASSGDMLLRNRVLKDMAKASPPGRKVRLSTGEDVIFWFNVGAPGAPRSRVHVTEARCPHQGVCLLGGELREIEDAMGISSASVRCPRHNKVFDLRSGASQGNAEILRTFPCRFTHGHWYVGQDVGDTYGEQPTPGTPTATTAVEEACSGQKMSWPRAETVQDRRGPVHKRLRLLDPDVFPDSAEVEAVASSE